MVTLPVAMLILTFAEESTVKPGALPVSDPTFLVMKCATTLRSRRQEECLLQSRLKTGRQKSQQKPLRAKTQFLAASSHRWAGGRQP